MATSMEQASMAALEGLNGLGSEPPAEAPVVGVVPGVDETTPGPDESAAEATDTSPDSDTGVTSESDSSPDGGEGVNDAAGQETVPTEDEGGGTPEPEGGEWPKGENRVPQSRFNEVNEGRKAAVAELEAFQAAARQREEQRVQREQAYKAQLDQLRAQLVSLQGLKIQELATSRPPQGDPSPAERVDYESMSDEEFITHLAKLQSDEGAAKPEVGGQPAATPQQPQQQYLTPERAQQQFQQWYQQQRQTEGQIDQMARGYEGHVDRVAEAYGNVPGLKDWLYESAIDAVNKGQRVDFTGDAERFVAAVQPLREYWAQQAAAQQSAAPAPPQAAAPAPAPQKAPVPDGPTWGGGTPGGSMDAVAPEKPKTIAEATEAALEALRKMTGQ